MEKKLTEKGKADLEDLKSQYGEEIGEEIFENTREPNDGTVR